MSQYNRAKQYHNKKHITFRWILNAVKKATPKRYCGSCERAYHHEDGFIRCEWLWEDKKDKICPYQKEEWEVRKK